ncbi:MAG: tRNA glutamyl-Q(34) synthetase GluQRS [Gammaproteobacteria bacterium]|jgi:glutamyl-Q tRNA(Asp) synthetase|nr:tRNA glutamyl-Q(34) synthetase GluQRS [Gammaproteobacteria bacterium]
MTYVGRFAPSPTGALHLGSLVAGLASYLDARAANGRWLLRIEDLDPPREQPGAGDLILATLEAFGFEWDADAVWQHTRLEAYAQALDLLQEGQHVYPCVCARKSFSGAYPGRCRSRNFAKTKEPYAIRMRVPEGTVTFSDRLIGPVTFDWSAIGDFIVRRKDTFFAYQLAVVVDDIASQVSHVIRGNDLLNSTPRQLTLYTALEATQPTFGHCATVVHDEGGKLSKQTGAKAVDPNNPGPTLLAALSCLGQDTAGINPAAPVAEIMGASISRWDPTRAGFAQTVNASGKAVV